MIRWRLVAPARGTGIGVTLAVALSAAAAAGPLDSSPLLAPGEGAVLRAGDEVTTRWSPLPDEVEEFELLLRLDDRAGTTIRLTDELPPGTTSHRWLVPNLPTTEARVIIRLSRGRGEEELPASPSFRILAATGERLAPLTRHHGEWWVRRDGAVTVPPLPPSEHLGTTVPALPTVAVADASDSQIEALPRCVVAPLPVVADAVLTTGARLTACLSSPRTFPLRP